jgi:hypothetical protein
MTARWHWGLIPRIFIATIRDRCQGALGSLACRVPDSAEDRVPDNVGCTFRLTVTGFGAHSRRPEGRENPDPLPSSSFPTAGALTPASKSPRATARRRGQDLCAAPGRARALPRIRSASIGTATSRRPPAHCGAGVDDDSGTKGVKTSIRFVRGNGSPMRPGRPAPPILRKAPLGPWLVSAGWSSARLLPRLPSASFRTAGRACHGAVGFVRGRRNGVRVRWGGLGAACDAQAGRGWVGCAAFVG